jgi:IS5 family transposase
MGLDLPVPDHSTLSRRAGTLAVALQVRTASGPVHLLVDSTGVKLSGPGEWLVEKHGTKRRRAWRKLHRGIDARTGRIVASTLTGKAVDDAAELGALLDQVEEALAAVVADGAYDQDRVYMMWPSTLRRLRLSCRRARPRCSVHRPAPIQPSVTAISRSLPSMAG